METVVFLWHLLQREGEAEWVGCGPLAACLPALDSNPSRDAGSGPTLLPAVLTQSQGRSLGLVAPSAS